MRDEPVPDDASVPGGGITGRPSGRHRAQKGPLTAMQIRLTVLAPPSGQTPARACDVLVTAPAGTALATVASGLAMAVAGPDGSLGSGAVVLFAGRERLDAQRCALGEPPLVDGAVLSLQAPGEVETMDDAVPARLQVIAGPDAGGVHLLHGGTIRIGRSAEADVPLDDPDVSRLHCEVTVYDDGRVAVADLGSTNGTSLDGAEVHDRPVRLAPGALLRLGESTLRLASGARTPALATTPDGEGHLRVARVPAAPAAPAPATDRHDHDLPAPAGPEAAARPGSSAGHPGRFPEQEAPRRGGIGAWARRFKGARPEPEPPGAPAQPEPPAPATFTALPTAPEGTWPDPAAVLLTALGPGPRLWERDPAHPEALVVRLGTTERAELPAVPVTVSLREAGSLGLAGPRERLSGLARSAVAQLAALHSPADLEIVLISTDRARTVEERRREWAWLGWLPHLRPMHGQDCRLLLAYDRDQALARTAELVRRLDDGPLGPGWASQDPAAVAEAAKLYEGPFTVVILDGDPGAAVLRENTARLAAAGAAAGIHLICLAETPAATPTSPVAATYEAACHASIAFRECGAVGMLSGDVATALRCCARRAAARRATARWPRWTRCRRTGRSGSAGRWPPAGGGLGRAAGPPGAGGAAAVRPPPGRTGPGPRHTGLPDGPLGLDGRRPAGRGAPARGSTAHRGRRAGRGGLGADAVPGCDGVGLGPDGVPPRRRERFGADPAPRRRRLRPHAVSRYRRLGPHAVSPHGRLGPHAVPRRRRLRPHPVSGRHDGALRPHPVPPRNHRRLRPHAVPGRRYGGLGPHPVPRLLRRPRNGGRRRYADRHAYRPAPRRLRRTSRRRARRRAPGAGERGSRGRGAAPAHRGARWQRADRAAAGRRGIAGRRRPAGPAGHRAGRRGGRRARRVPAPVYGAAARVHAPGGLGPGPDAGVRPGAGRRGEAAGRAARRAGLRRVAQPPRGRGHDRADPRTARRHRVVLHRHPPPAPGRGPPVDPGPSPLPRLVVLVDDFDALMAPALGSPGRPAAGSVVRALEAVARDGGRLGIHLVATSARPDRTEDTELARGARLRIVLDPPAVPPSPDEPAPGRGRLGHPDGRVTPFQGGRVTGRIPRTATLRPTVVPLEWERMGDPPTRRPVRELGNGPTDLALLASALERAARSVNAQPLAPLSV